MVTILESPISKFSSAAIEAIQFQYPNAVVRIEIENSLYKSKMDEAQFWAILALLDWKTRNSDAIHALIFGIGYQCGIRSCIPS